MTREAYEFAFWALIIVGAGTALLMYQHAQHSGMIMNMINGRLLGAPGAGVNQAVTTIALSDMAGPPQQTSTAFGLWSPIGPLGNDGGPFLYNPPQPGGY